MDWKGLHRQLLSVHSGRPQEVRAIEIALREAEVALNALSRLGHQFHLSPGPGPLLPPWPRILYNLYVAPNGRLVRDEDELEVLGPGWYDTLEDAQHANGKETQMRSRGNVPRPATVPMVIERQLREDERFDARIAHNTAAKETALKERNE